MNVFAPGRHSVMELEIERKYAFIPSYYQRRAVIPTRRFWHALCNIKSAPRIRGLVIAWGRWNAFPIFLGRSGCTPPIHTARFFLNRFFFFHSLCIYHQKALVSLLVFPSSDATLSLRDSFWEITGPRALSAACTISPHGQARSSDPTGKL